MSVEIKVKTKKGKKKEGEKKMGKTKMANKKKPMLQIKAALKPVAYMC